MHMPFMHLARLTLSFIKPSPQTG